MRENFQVLRSFRNGLVQLGILTVLALGSVSCAARIPETSSGSAIENCEKNKVHVTDVHWFRDAGGAWRIVGTITNNSSKAVNKLVTDVETKTIDEAPADQGEDVSAYPLNLQPGAQAPFTAWIDREIPNLDHFEVEVEECILAEETERSQVEVRGGQMVIDDAGFAQVTAQLFNPGTKTVLINGLMAAAYDATGRLVTAEYVDIASRYLAPGESGPVRASLDLPQKGASQIKSYQFFMEALVSEPPTLIIDNELDLKVLSHYVDQQGHFHLLGQLTNPGDSSLMASVQATVYSDSARTAVVDAAEYSTWLPLAPGETRLFDLVHWGVLNNTPGSWDEIAGAAAIDLRIEPFLTWTSATAPVELVRLNENVVSTGSEMHFTGKAKNDSDRGITTALVTIMLRQKAGGHIVAVGDAHLEIGDSVAPGQDLDYSLTLQLPDGVDPDSLETEIIARGFQP
jgi:hypothetical protein